MTEKNVLLQLRVIRAKALKRLRVLKQEVGYLGLFGKRMLWNSIYF
jgi:hypothetical protein